MWSLLLIQPDSSTSNIICLMYSWSSLSTCPNRLHSASAVSFLSSSHWAVSLTGSFSIPCRHSRCESQRLHLSRLQFSLSSSFPQTHYFLLTSTKSLYIWQNMQFYITPHFKKWHSQCLSHEECCKKEKKQAAELLFCFYLLIRTDSQW